MELHMVSYALLKLKIMLLIATEIIKLSREELTYEGGNSPILGYMRKYDAIIIVWNMCHGDVIHRLWFGQAK
eukprot:snap_masked-scaffold_12-processed-gene-7.31-mRNA-1 protein AED:1.00 eAED:1.00 QI:0/0/0/0/1/1/2/0/71